MPMTPVEVRHLELRRGLFGYKRAAVHRAMEDVADSFEEVWRERAALAEQVHALETELSRHVELETLLRSTLVSAERAAQDLKEQGRREADMIVTEANAEARRVLRDAITEKERLSAEARRVQAILRSALEVLEEAPPPEEASVETTASTGEPAMRETEHTQDAASTSPGAETGTDREMTREAGPDEDEPAPGFRRLAG